MDSNIAADIRLIRSVIGRKVMELDEYNVKAENAVGMEADAYMDLIEFLENDIAGYKAIVDDLKDGICDYTGDLYEIASLPEHTIGIYNDLYLPALCPEDFEDEQKAMVYKGEYAMKLARNNLSGIGEKALVNPKVIDNLSKNKEFAELVGRIVVDDPELYKLIK